MGNTSSISKANFEDIQHSIKNKSSYIINVLNRNEQQCLIQNTMNIDDEEQLMNNLLEKGNNHYSIIIYGKNTNDMKVYEKYNQLVQLGFTNISIYIGGVFEWMLLQDIYGNDNFPTTTSELDILKFKPLQVLYAQRIH
uniref:Rhodanese domain-containing protein n=1 Tax=viral metagenome TaxID=1070528 RepID=A0A6C0EG51_9ZZZZ